ncbi:MAG: radical SAM protein [Myxococcales bacterium]
MHLTLHLTPGCNMACSYCYAPPHPGPAMSEAVAAKALELACKTSQASAGIVFFGGEPLLHQDLIAATMARAKELESRQPVRFHFKVTTNGLLLDDAFLERSLANDLFVAMSFDGVREAHDRHRRLPDGSPTFDWLLPKLKMLLAARPYSSVLMVVNPDTVKHFCDSVEFLLDQGARYLIVSLNFAADWTEDDLAALEKQYRRLGEKYVKWTREGRKFYLSPFEVKLSSHINQHCHRKERCELARRQLSVGPDGALYPCVQFTKAGPLSSWCIGNLDQGIDEAARTRIHDSSEAEKEVCKGCAIQSRCNNSCGCLNWQTTGTINGVSPVLCRHEQLLTPIADQMGETLYAERNALFLQKHYNAAYPVLSLIEDARKAAEER